MSSEKNITTADMNSLRHMLGAVPDRYPINKWGFRNHFCAGGGAQTESMRRLESAGLVTQGMTQEDSTFFHATEKGMAWVGMSKAAIKRCQEDE